MRKLFFITTILSSFILSGFARADKPVLDVYTYDYFASEWGPGPLIKQSFEATCDCSVNYVVTADSVAMLSKILLEGKNSKADVLVGLDNNIARRAADSGLFAPHQVVPPKFSAPSVIWQSPLFAPFDWGVFSFIYNQETLTNPPKSFADLQNLPKETKIVLQDPRTSTPGYGLLLWLDTIDALGSDAAWKAMRPNILTFTKGWSDAYNMYLEGQADLVLSYTTSPAYHIIAEGTDKHKAAIFDEGHLAQVELAGVIAHSAELELGRAFVAHLQSKEVQSIIPTTNWMFPIRDDVPLPDGFKGLPMPEKLFVADPDKSEKMRKNRIQRWQAAVQ